MKKNLWGGRFTKSLTDYTADYNESISFDHKLFRQDIAGSLAHVQMLADCKILTQAEAAEISEGLRHVEGRLERGEIEYNIHDEDIMMCVEKELIAKIGDVGKKLHTARSRNDQNAVDEKLYLKSAIEHTMSLITDLCEVILAQAEANKDLLMPGFTHLQHAQPITAGFYLMAHFQQFRRDLERFEQTYERTDLNPLGACALAGTTLPIDRFITTSILGFKAPTENALDTVGDRDHFAEYLFNAALCMVHLSGFAEEIIVFCSQEFDFVRLDDSFCTGSSIMPQKRNPDIAELVRGKAGRAIGNLVNLLTVLKGTFLTLNKDYQEDKEALFDSVHTLDRSLFVFARMLEGMIFKADNLRAQLKKGFIEATDLAEQMVVMGIPFREAHERVGEMVKYCEQKQIDFTGLNAEDLKILNSPFNVEEMKRFTVDNCVSGRTSFGATAVSEVERQIAVGRSFLNERKVADGAKE